MLGTEGYGNKRAVESANENEIFDNRISNCILPRTSRFGPPRRLNPKSSKADHPNIRYLL